MSIPQEPSPPPEKLPRVEQTTEPPQQRGRTQQSNTIVPPESAPCQIVNRKMNIIITQWRSKRQLPQTETHIIPDDTEVRSQLTHPYDGSKCNVPLLHRYNTRSRQLKGQNLMANHMATIPPHRQPPTSLPKYMVHRTGEYLAHTNKNTG